MKFFKKSSEKKTKNRAALMAEERKHLLSASSDFFIREAYKTLRTNVFFSLTGDTSSKTVMITSSLQSEGKSITALNLAISFAQTDRKVIIVDCDLRRPKLARLLQASSRAGLSNLLMDESLQDEAILHTEIPNLDALLSGDIPPNPSELLSSPRMMRLLEKLKEQYDYVVLDTPPVNVVIDAVALAPNVDGVLFVVRANQSERGPVINAVEQLEYAKGKVLGFVLNGVDLESTSYGYAKRRYGYKKYGYKKYGYGRYGYSRYGYSKYAYGYSSRREYQAEKDEMR